MDAIANLPRAKRSGAVPDDTPRFAHLLAQRWHEDREAEGHRPTALGTPFRHSDAGKCARYLSYVAAGIPASDPMDLTGTWTTGMGTQLHDEWQAELQRRYPDAEIEVTVRSEGVDGSGHIDAVIRMEGPAVSAEGDHPEPTVIAYELKTIGGFAYKHAVGAASKGKPAEGPKSDHLIQAALNGVAVDADEVVIGYLAREPISPVVANRFGLGEHQRFCAEWTYTRDQFTSVAADEAARVSGILALVDGGELARRIIPFETPLGAEIVDPSHGRWEQRAEGGDVIDTGVYWSEGQGCWAYCRFASLCTALPSGRIPVASAVEVAVGMGLMDAPDEAA